MWPKINKKTQKEIKLGYLSSCCCIVRVLCIFWILKHLFFRVLRLMICTWSWHHTSPSGPGNFCGPWPGRESVPYKRHLELAASLATLLSNSLCLWCVSPLSSSVAPFSCNKPYNCKHCHGGFLWVFSGSPTRFNYWDFQEGELWLLVAWRFLKAVGL